MDFYFRMCVAVSVGLLVGTLAGSFRLIRKLGGFHLPGGKAYTEKQLAFLSKLKKAVQAGAEITKYLVFVLLIVGLVWCVYYLVLGAVYPEQAEYATSMSQLIISVLTIVSIFFAFLEFVRRQ